MGPGDLYARHVELDSGLSGILVIAGLAVGGLGLLLAFGANRRIDRMRRSFALLQGADGEATVVETVDRNIADGQMVAGWAPRDACGGGGHARRPARGSPARRSGAL